VDAAVEWLAARLLDRDRDPIPVVVKQVGREAAAAAAQ
jgi:hypothetical protein